MRYSQAQFKCSQIEYDIEYSNEVTEVEHIDSLVQDCSISIAVAMEILQSCTKPSIYRTLNLQKMSHMSPWRVSYGMWNVNILENIDDIIMALHCIYVKTESHNSFITPFTYHGAHTEHVWKCQKQIACWLQPEWWVEFEYGCSPMLLLEPATVQHSSRSPLPRIWDRMSLGKFVCRWPNDHHWITGETVTDADLLED